MKKKPELFLDEMEMDLLQEFLNISFGRATAELAEIIDIFIHLHQPRIDYRSSDRLFETLKTEISDFECSSIIEQHFYGDIQGLALLVFPKDADKELLSYFQNYTSSALDRGSALDQGSLIELEKEVLMEVGSILMGACLGNLFKLLKCRVNYLAPRTTTGMFLQNGLLKETIRDHDFAITMRTGFQFEDRDLSGHLYIINRYNSGEQFRKHIEDFLENYNAQ